MYGDYSRGHEPDRKRGRNYRRVLLQMGRAVLDSDVAAMVDAVLGEVQTAVRGLGCASGSPDLGFLVTPGRLLAIFAESGDDLTVTQGTPDACIDYRFRFAERYPALHVAAGGTLARIELPLLQPLDPAAGPSRAALWARVEAPVTIGINGIPVDLAPESPDAMQRVEFATGAATLDPLSIAVPAGAEVWLLLLEQHEAAGTDPAFWVAPGSYHVDGLIVDAHGGGPFPMVAFPETAGFPWADSPPAAPVLDGVLAPGGLAANDRVVAYLETWERHITAVEDPGIREVALGASDTCARTELLGQVKLATLSGVLPAGPAGAAAVRRAFTAVEVSGGRLTIDLPPETPTTDPCALPDLAGYSGGDNRLYRVEVHRGGDLSQLRLKWSRDNGSELFAARVDNTRNLVFDAGTALAGGDIVEVLDNVVDLGDDVVARVGAAGFVPARRAVGQLAQLAAVQLASSSDEVVFRLVDPDDIATGVLLDEHFSALPDAVLKLRRWHGILDPQQVAGAGGVASPGPHVLEDGITVQLSGTGSYRPGQYWQYEARVGGANANGPWQPAPHGPQRRFAPLALLEYAAPDAPLRLLAWLDERFSHPCELDADDVSFAGARVHSTSGTVQEALEELFDQPPLVVDASCGEIIVRPENDLQAVFDTIPELGSARLCIHPGTWAVKQTVTVRRKGDLVISGAGGATRLVGDVSPVLTFVDCGHVRMQDLTVEGGAPGAPGAGMPGAIASITCRGLDLERVSVSCRDATARGSSAVKVHYEGPAADATEVRIRDCHVQVGNAQLGLLLLNAASVDIEGNVISAPERPWPLKDALQDPTVAGRARRLLLDDIILGETEEANDELLVGSPDIVAEASPAGSRRRFIVHLEAWGNQFVTFTTTLSLNANLWFQVFERNPIPGNWSRGAAPDGFLLSNLRSLGRRLVRGMFGLGGGGLNLPSQARQQLLQLAKDLTDRNAVTTGGQGIVVAGRGSVIDPGFPQPDMLADPHPAARITGNRILGFVQGIHVGTSGGSGNRGMSHRVSIADNLVQLRVPSLPGERHGIFVGSVFHLRIHGNSVEVSSPAAADWGGLTDPLDGIRAYGTFGPLIQIRENSCIGTRRGVVAHAINAVARSTGWRWTATDNAHITAGVPATETINW